MNEPLDDYLVVYIYEMKKMYLTVNFLMPTSYSRDNSLHLSSPSLPLVSIHP